MKLIKRHIEKDGSGSITLRPERAEDMWHAYNLIQEVFPSPLFKISTPIISDDSYRETRSERKRTGKLIRLYYFATFAQSK